MNLWLYETETLKSMLFDTTNVWMKNFMRNKRDVSKLAESAVITISYELQERKVKVWTQHKNYPSSHSS